MRDPHVQSMVYDVGAGEGISYHDPEPITFSNDLGVFELAAGKLRIKPAEHFPNEDSACRALDPFLRAWEIEADLTSNIGSIRFKFADAEIIDRDPPPPGSPRSLRATMIGRFETSDDVKLHITRNKYPQPPVDFQATHEVQLTYRRWIGYRCGEEPLQSMAYFLLTVLERFARGRQNAATEFAISKRVLNKVGELSSTKGDESTARKAPKGEQYQELSSSEKRWLDKAVCKVIYRLGEHASGAPLTKITLADLPKL